MEEENSKVSVRSTPYLAMIALPSIVAAYGWPLQIDTLVFSAMIIAMNLCLNVSILTDG